MNIKNIIITGVCISCLLTVFASVDAVESTPKHGGVLKIIRYSGPGTPIGWPGKSRNSTLNIGGPALESLIVVNLKNLEIAPKLATAWQTDPNNKTITFTLRKGVKFHDGTDFNAEAVKWNLDEFKKAKMSGSEFWRSIEIIDDYTIRIGFTEWRNTWTGRSLGGVKIISPTAYKKMGQKEIEWYPVGTGPFKFVNHTKDVSTEFTKFDQYWQKGKPYLDGVKWIYVRDRMTQSAGLQAGEGDVLYTQVGKTVADLQEKGYKALLSHDGFLNFIPDSANPDSPWADKRVRMALEYSINKEEIVETLGYGFWEPAYQYPPTFAAGHIPNLKVRRYDPEKAKELLVDAGYSKGFKSRIISFPGAPKNMLLSVQAYAAKVGIDLNIEFPDMGRFYEFRLKGWKNGLLCGPFAIFPNSGEGLFRYYSSASNDHVSLGRPMGLEDMIMKAIRSPEIDNNLLQKTIKLIVEEAVTIPTHYTGAVRQFDPNVVRDAGFLEYESKDDWNPENAWLNK